LKFNKVTVYLTAYSILAPKGAQGFLVKDSIPMLALVIAIHKDKISIRRADVTISVDRATSRS
jgi:hypothetical protein